MTDKRNGDRVVLREVYDQACSGTPPKRVRFRLDANGSAHLEEPEPRKIDADPGK